MTEKEWMKEGLDFKLTAILFLKKIWLVLLCAFAGAAFAGGLYFLLHVVYAPAREYEAVSKLYLEFATDDDGDAYQYYNGYTWNDLMGTEPIRNKMMEQLPGMDQNEVREAVAADILSDIRLLTVTVTTHDAEKTQALIRAAEDALVRFGSEMAEFEEIRVIEHGQAGLVAVEDETVRAVLLGAVAGVLFCLLGLWFVCVLDDSIYVPSQFEKRYGYPVFGVRFAGKGGSALEELELQTNLEYLTAGRENEVRMSVEKCREELPDYEVLRKSGGVILEILYGRGNGKWIEKQISQLRKQDCEILGAVLMDVDQRVYRMYMAGRKA